MRGGEAGTGDPAHCRQDPEAAAVPTTAALAGGPLALVCRHRVN
jgi:hypothetical protein